MESVQKYESLTTDNITIIKTIIRKKAYIFLEVK